jgi:hypothetical protein
MKLIVLHQYMLYQTISAILNKIYKRFGLVYEIYITDSLK